MNQTAEHMVSPVASHTSSVGNSAQHNYPVYDGEVFGYRLQRSRKLQQMHQQIKELLKERLNKLGPVKTLDAWAILHEKFVYGVASEHFRYIMQQLRREGRADFVRNGTWFIHKQSKLKCRHN